MQNKANNNPFLRPEYFQLERVDCLSREEALDRIHELVSKHAAEFPKRLENVAVSREEILKPVYEQVKNSYMLTASMLDSLRKIRNLPFKPGTRVDLSRLDMAKPMTSDELIRFMNEKSAGKKGQ